MVCEARLSGRLAAHAHAHRTWRVAVVAVLGGLVDLIGGLHCQTT
jgi:hypothetical protein